MDRRELMRWMLATGGLAALNGISERELMDLGHAASAHVHAQPRARWRSLSVAQSRVVTIAAEHIIPASDTPGATEARVAEFIDHMMTEWYSPAERTVFVSGLDELETRSRARYQRAFVECVAADQVALLTSFDDDVSALRRARAANANDHWFSTLKYLTVYGYCTSEPAMRKHFKSYPLPMRYDGNAPAAAK